MLANTDNSVDRLVELSQETYLCPSLTGYVTPLRAVNTAGKWRIVVNGVKAHYETLTQTARLEECTGPGEACPLVPACYNTQCIQKNIYHRFQFIMCILLKPIINLIYAFLGFLCMIPTITTSHSPSRHSSCPPPAPVIMAHSLMLTRPDIRQHQKLGSHLFFSSVDFTCSSEYKALTLPADVWKYQSLTRCSTIER